MTDRVELITLCILAKFHAERFRTLIDTALPHVDEIIVGVDDGAEDGIIDYRVGEVKYLRVSVKGAYGSARNLLLSQSTKPWRMTLDTDEALPVDLWPRLRTIADNAVEPLVAFPRNNAIAGLPERLSWPDWQPRLHREHIHWRHDLHESLTPEDRKEYLPQDKAHAIVHSKTVADQHDAIRRYVGLQGKKQAILIFEHKRPNYLRICLDSLACCLGVEEWSTLVSIDGPEYIRDFEPIFDRVSHIVPWDNHAGNLWHVTRSLEFAFSCGFERVLFIDGDCVLRPDALSTLPISNGDYLFTGLSKGDCGSGPVSWFAPQGNLVERDPARQLLEWVRSRAWVGRQRPGHKTTLGIDYPGYDAIYCRYLIDMGLKTLYRSKSYIGHIGVCGTDCHAPEIEAEIFTGHPSRWFQQALKAFDPKRHNAFTPPDFVYRGP